MVMIMIMIMIMRLLIGLSCLVVNINLKFIPNVVHAQTHQVTAKVKDKDVSKAWDQIQAIGSELSTEKQYKLEHRKTKYHITKKIRVEDCHVTTELHGKHGLLIKHTADLRKDKPRR